MTHLPPNRPSHRRWRTGRTTALVAVAVVAAAFMLMRLHSGSGTAEGWGANATVGQLGGGAACKNKDDLDKEHQLKNDGLAAADKLHADVVAGRVSPENFPKEFTALIDSSAWAKWWKEHKENGTCRDIGAWEDVAIEAQDGQISCVRTEGQATCFWIDNEAIKLRLGDGFVFGSIGCKDRDLVNSEEKAVALARQYTASLPRGRSTLPSGCRWFDDVAEKSYHPADVTIEKLVGINARIRVQGEDGSYWTLKQWIDSTQGR